MRKIEMLAKRGWEVSIRHNGYGFDVGFNHNTWGEAEGYDKTLSQAIDKAYAKAKKMESW